MNRSLPKGIERFAAFVYNKIAKHHQQESEDIGKLMEWNITETFLQNVDIGKFMSSINEV